MSWRSKRESRGLERLVNEQMDTWRTRASQQGFRIGQLTMSQWWDIMLPEIDSFALECVAAREGDSDAAGRAQIGYRSMTLTCEWLTNSNDQAAVATACVASYDAVNAAARAALGEVLTNESGIPLHLELQLAASNAWMHLGALAMKSDQDGANDRG